MDFWQSVTTFSLVFGLISSLVAVLGFFVDVTKIKHKHKILLVSVPLALIFNSITSDQTSGETDWVFTLVNASGSSCGSVGFSPVPTLGSTQAQGQTTGWAMSQGQQLLVTMIFPQSQTGVSYDLNVKLAFQKCVSSSGGHSSGSDIYQTEAFVF